MANGEGCKCFAGCENDCCCDVDWRSDREIELEVELKKIKHKARRYVQITEHLKPCPGTMHELLELIT